MVAHVSPFDAFLAAILLSDVKAGCEVILS